MRGCSTASICFHIPSISLLSSRTLRFHTLWPPSPLPAMDTSDFGMGAARAAAGGDSGILKAPHAGLKVKVSTKRGARTSKQKRRKEKALERALGFTERLDTKTAAVEPRQLTKKAAKQLWRADD